MSRGCGLATDRKAVRRRGPGRVVLGSKPQLATAKKLVRWAGDSTQARSLRLHKNSCAGLCELDLNKNPSKLVETLGEAGAGAAEEGFAEDGDAAVAEGWRGLPARSGEDALDRG